MANERLYYLLLMGLATALSVVKMLIYAALMSPVAFAEVSLLLTSYAFVLSVTSFGAVEGFLKLGSLSGGGAEARLDVNAILIWGGILVGGLSTILVAVMLWLNADLGMANMWMVIGLCVSALLFNTLETLCRVNQRFIAFATLVAVKGALATLLGGLLALTDRSALVLGAEIAALASVALVYALFFERVALRPAAGGWTRFVKLARHGAPLFLSNATRKLLYIADRWAVGALLGLTALAEYSFLMFIYLAAVSVTGIFNMMLGPKLLARLGSDGDLAGMRKRVYRIMLKALAVLLPLFLVFTVVYPPLVGKFFPVYDSANVHRAAPYIALGMVVFFLNSIFDWLMIGAGQSYRLVAVNALALLVGIAGYLIFGYTSSAGLLAFSALFFAVRGLSLALSVVFFELKYRQVKATGSTAR